MKTSEILVIIDDKTGATPFKHAFGSLALESQGSVHVRVEPAFDVLKTNFSSVAVIVMQIKKWSTAWYALVFAIRGKGFNGQIVVAIEDEVTLSDELLKRNSHFKNVALLCCPTDKKIVGVVRRALGNRIVQTRRNDREQVNCAADFHYNENALNALVNIQDISDGGACLKFQEEVPVEVGEQITIRFRDSLKGLHQTQVARIAWVQSYSQQVGIAFVKTASL